MLKRYAVYTLFIVVFVSVALFVLTIRRPEEGRPAGFRGQPAQPQKPWAPTAAHDAEANADFHVETRRADNVRLAGTSPGAEWPQFAGSHRDNKSPETGLLPRWPSGGPALAWISRGLGAGFSTVSVVKGVAYTMGNKGESEAVIALDAGTGEKVWSTPIGWASHQAGGNGPRGTPSVSNGAVYGLGANGDLACLDAGSGKIRWQQNILQEFKAPNPTYGTCESVLIDENRLICTPGGDAATLVALDPQTGRVIWKSLVPDKDRAGYASPIVAEAGGVRQYVQFTAAGTVGVRADHGDFLWRDNSAANGSANCSSPLAAGDLIFTASAYGAGGSLVKVIASHAKIEAQLVYHTPKMQSHYGEMVIVDGLLYGASEQILTCLDLETGQLKWQNRSVGKGSLTYAEGRIYLRSEKGPVALVEATGSGYHELGRFEPRERSGADAWSHPVVAAGKLFLRDQDLLLCYDLKPRK